MNPQEIAHWNVLKVLEQQPQLSQRELALRLGVSLGKTHYLMKALVEKGWVKAGNFRRSDNKWAYLYLLTPDGVGERLRLTRAYLARKEAEYASLRNEIAMLRQEIEALPVLSAGPLVEGANVPLRDGEFLSLSLRVTNGAARSDV
ncbi:MarR family EPS-associated transcriptional regulator [Rhodocyclus tenuis]|uniref:MarR family EPS-associated transcriptional regulator n=1 Tax=Rhodocyclus gracilis TaxID=2929842 RepID=A0ABX0WJ76_9RHOO|nr:MarR family EPS-associated transcriptional regulator [Rhodocyclus gracilis]